MKIKQNFCVLSGIIISAIMIISFISCSNDERDLRMSSSQAVKELQVYATIHNTGLDFIKEKVAQTPNNYRLDSIFNCYVRLKYGYDESATIINKISPLTKRFFCEMSPNLVCSRSYLFNVQNSKTNELALKALKTCMDKIHYCIAEVNNDDMFDNKYLLSDLHLIINKTYIEFSDSCKSKFDIDALKVTLGTLYGSVEYWSNSKNVESWSGIQVSYAGIASTPLQTRGNAKKETSKKLSKAEWIQLVADADAAGAIAGSWFGPQAGAAAGLAASAAVAATYEVE